MDKALFHRNASQNSTIYAGLTALVADEFENSRVSIRQMLQGLGVQNVDQTASGKGVLESCRARRYDIILCDFRLTGGKNGQQVLEELRELKLLKPTNIFIIVSAETSRDVVMGIMESQPDEYLSKPFTQAVLARRLERQFLQTQALAKMKENQAKGRYSQLIQACIEHIQEEGRYTPWCKRTLVDAYLATQQFDQVEQLCQAELSVRDLDWALLGLAKKEAAQGHNDAAIVILEKLLRLFPQTINAYDLMAKCLEDSGRLEEAQSVLDDAIKISPRIHKRQKHMATVSMANGDTQSALKASQQTVRLGINSIHENPDDYIQLVDIVAESADSVESSVDRKRLLNEASQALAIVGKRFADDDSVKLRKSLAESRFHAAQGQKKEAQNALTNAKQIAAEMEGGLPPDLVVEYGKTLYNAGEHEQAESILASLVNDQNSSAHLKQLAADFLDEPVSSGAKAQAKALNKDGLASYAKKEYLEAIEQFKTALNYSPRHPGLNLNLVQTCLKLMEAKGEEAYLVAECVQAFQRLRHVSPAHKQHKRLISLKEYLVKHYNVTF
ncbi:tetratricopeptide repeat protein [Marinomonas fungiae]|uniref:CheY chemotaxis protein or a CheY-like REC (Receiver) domain n=1 Tax=Marinomonas fungiae TaxID=1137284 RepID=A0A0K6IJZ5_9GAMM|nr:tetratricopeptide repeat protein [Marinomonas fungiae]CUB03428.1 CheY chemotaxis protein or a CheY-like REC (receiver) domain [Marinomonas fungiae]